jgi:adenylate kinase
LKRGEVSGRKDDNLETITKRLAVFKEQTDPLKEYYKKKGLLIKVKGDDTVEEVFQGIVDVINHLIDK